MSEITIVATELAEIEELENKLAPSGQWEVNGRTAKKEYYSVIWI